MHKFLDVVERAAWTFAEVFAASVVLSGSLNLTDVKIAAGAAALAVLKTLSIESTVRGQLKVLGGLKAEAAEAEPSEPEEPAPRARRR